MDNNKELELVQNLADYLNRILEVDPTTINSMFSTIFQCNEEFAKDPHVVCWKLDDFTYGVRIIGILNGFISQHTDKYLLNATIDEDNINITSFGVLKRQKVNKDD
jgi:hypothetical protein